MRNVLHYIILVTGNDLLYACNHFQEDLNSLPIYFQAKLRTSYTKVNTKQPMSVVDLILMFFYCLMWFQTSSSQDMAAWLGTDLIYSILKTFYLQYILATTSTSKLPQKNFGSIILLRGIKRTYIIEFDLSFQHWVPRNEHGAKVPLADFSRIELFFK